MKLKLNKTIIASIITSTVFFGSCAHVETTKTDKLATVLTSQPEKTQARYDARHPQETLDFFGIKPSMTVLEALPSGGWYSKLLIPFLGSKGALISVDYAVDMYPKFGFFSKEDLKAKETWAKDWAEKANGWKTKDSASIKAYTFGSLTSEVKGKVDAVVFIRALHNIARFENDGGYLTKALKDAFDSLKSDGIVGVVRHMVSESADDKGVNGSRSYLKKSFLISTMEKAGF